AEESASFAIGNLGYVGTGNINTSSCSNEFWEYDSALNTWTKKISLPNDGRAGAIGFSIGGKGYIGLGDIGCSWSLPNDLWEYTPAKSGTTTSTSEIKNNIELNISPNPTSGLFTIQSSEKFS